MAHIDPRAALMATVEQAGLSLAALSARIGRNPAYLQQYVRRGTPRILPEAERRALARILNIDEARIGGPAPAAEVRVPLLAIDAAAGPGSLAEADVAAGHIALPPALLREAGVAPRRARFVRAAGGSMEPGIRDGDRLLVDEGDVAVPRGEAGAKGRSGGGGVFVLRVDGTLRVKRLRRTGRGVEVHSDADPAAMRVYRADEVTILGRVKLLVRDRL